MKRIIAVCISIILCAAILQGCGNRIENESDEGAGQNPLTGEVLIDFENAKNTLSSIRLASNIDKAEFCTDSNYVSQGESCLRICPEIEPIEEGKYYGDYEIVFYPAKIEFLDTEYVCLDVYNPTDATWLAVFGCSRIKQEYSIQPGQNALWLYIDRAQIEFADSGLIEDFYLKIQGGNWETKPLDIYIDNFRIYYSDTEYTKYSNYFTQNEWYSFEQSGDLMNFTCASNKKSEFAQPVFSLNRDFRCVKNGIGSLKVQFRNDMEGDIGPRDFCLKDNQLGDLNQYLDDLSNYYIAFPIYNANDFEIQCIATVQSNYNGEKISVASIIPAHGWTGDDFIISLKDMKDAFTGTGFDVKTISFSFIGIADSGTVYLDSIGVYPIAKGEE